jgi:hypothetical protein
MNIHHLMVNSQVFKSMLEKNMWLKLLQNLKNLFYHVILILKMYALLNRLFNSLIKLDKFLQVKKLHLMPIMYLPPKLPNLPENMLWVVGSNGTLLIHRVYGTQFSDCPQTMLIVMKIIKDLVIVLLVHGLVVNRHTTFLPSPHIHILI